jgi:hypothetical protein
LIQRKVAETVKFLWPVSMPTFSTLKCMLVLWNANGCEFWDLPKEEDIQLEASGESNDDEAEVITEGDYGR